MQLHRDLFETDMTAVLPEKVKEASVVADSTWEIRIAGAGSICSRISASSDAAYITGQVLHVDGGMVM